MCTCSNTINFKATRIVLSQLWLVMQMFLIFVILRELMSCYGYDNLSHNKVSGQSSTWACSDCSQYAAENAVDNDNQTCSRSAYFGHNSPLDSAWWYVDLGGTKSIYRINIIYKNYRTEYVMRQRGRMAGFSLFISNSSQIKDGYLCYKDEKELPPLNFSAICPRYGRYVIFYNERLAGVKYPTNYQSLTRSVVVEGCESGMYGDNCILTCPTKCPEHICAIESGHCFGCAAGWLGTECQEQCKNGTYGLRCIHKCGHCLNGAPCDKETGRCDTDCEPGYQLDLCNKACEKGSYGRSCKHDCGYCFNRTVCDRFTGICNTECDPGYFGERCTLICGHCVNGAPCDKSTGICNTECDPGYLGERCKKECLPGMFGKNCSFYCTGHCFHNESCNPVNGSCNNGCTAGYRGKNCEEVCEPRFYGVNCREMCSFRCLETCDYIDGFCRCTAGWMGPPKCTTACPPNFYGIDCRHQCSDHCSNNDTCGRYDGTCDDGCQEPFLGRICDHQNFTEYKEKSVCIHKPLSTAWIAGMTVSLTSNLFAVVIIIFKMRHCQLDKRGNRRPEQCTTVTEPRTLNDGSKTHNYEEINNTAN